MNNYNSFIYPSKIRFINKVLDEKINIYLNNYEIIKGLNYQQITQFIPIKSAIYNIKIYSISNNLLLNENVDIIGNKLITINKDHAGNVKLFITDDMGSMHNNGIENKQKIEKAKIRFAHFSPDLSNIDVIKENGNTLYRNIGYGIITHYINLKPGSYNLQVKLSDSNNLLLSIPDFILLPNDKKTIYVIGLLKGNPMLETIVIKD